MASTFIGINVLISCNRDAIARNNKSDGDRVGFFHWKIIDPCVQVFSRFVFLYPFIFTFISFIISYVLFYCAFLFEISGKPRQKNIRCLRSKHRHEYHTRVGQVHGIIALHWTHARSHFGEFIIKINSIPCHDDEGLSVLRTSHRRTEHDCFFIHFPPNWKIKRQCVVLVQNRIAKNEFRLMITFLCNRRRCWLQSLLVWVIYASH